MDNLTILHLSDLHFQPSGRRDMTKVKKALFEDLEDLSARGIAPDIVVFSGDLIFAGDYGYSEGRNDFLTVQNEFISPLLELLSLESNYFFICPGNHDIQKKAVKKQKYLETGLKNELKDRKSINEFIDDLENNAEAFNRMTNFEKFRGSLTNRFEISGNALFSSYRLDLHGKTVGVACINSAWRACGERKEDERLLVGERTIDDCIEDVKDCDVRIGVMHHPFEYLANSDMMDLRRRVYTAFNIWFQGHMHEPDFNHIQTFNDHDIVVLSGGTLYKSRDYHNGYSLVRISLADGNGQIHLREYDDRQGFGAATAYASNEGIASFKLTHTSDPTGGHLTMISQIRDPVVEGFNNMMLPVVLGQTTELALANIFVAPILSKKPETMHRGESKISRDSEDSMVELDDVLRSDRNIMFLGKEEVGKTTLLHYICTEYLEKPNSFDPVRIPLLVNYKDLSQKGKNRTKRALKDYASNFSMELDLETSLRRGECLILIDDFEHRNQKNLADLIQFAETYSENRFILTSDENLFLDEDYLKPPKLGIEYDQLYIHSFGKKQIRSLVDKWFQEDLEVPQRAQLAEEIRTTLMVINIPPTPLTISLLLLILEQQTDFIPINKASLLDRLVKILLEKLKPTDQLAGGMDYRNKEHFLSHLASWMVKKDNYRPTMHELVGITIRYFEARGLTTPDGPQNFIEDLISRGILMQSGGQVHFRFRCLGEFFIAKHMIEDNRFYGRNLSEERYLSFSSEIEYLTGLQRNNQDIVQLMCSRSKASVDQFLESSGLKVGLEHFDRIGPDRSFLGALSEEEIDRFEQQEKIDKSENDEDLKEIIEEAASSYMRELADQRIVRYTYEDSRDLVFSNLSLFASVIRNCELIANKQFKKENVKLCMELFLKTTFIFTLGMERFIESLNDEEISDLFIKLDMDPSDDVSANRYAVKAIMVSISFQFFHDFLYRQLGTPKLEVVLNEEINDLNNHVLIRLACMVLYADLRLPGSIDKLESIWKEVRKNDFYGSIIVMRLIVFYAMKLHTARESKQIENLLAEIIAVNKNIPSHRKSMVLGQLKKFSWYALS